MGKDCAARFSRRSLRRKDRAGRLGRDGGAEGVLEVDDKKKIVKRRLYVSAFCGWDFRNKSNFSDK